MEAQLAQPYCQYPALVHRCEFIDPERHVAAWHTSSIRLNWHLERNHGVTAPSNRDDWSTLHVMLHEESTGHGLEIPPWHRMGWAA